MARTDVKWLLVGAGAIAAKRIAAALAGAQPGGLVAVCDVVKENAERIAAAHGASEVYANIDEALGKTKATAVYVATPVFLHVAHAIKAIQAGKHGNVFTDTSSSTNISPGQIEFAVQEVGPERILYGTDSPLYFAPMHRTRIELAEISDEAKRLILHDNAAALLKT